MSLRGPTADTLAGDIVEIQLNPDPPYGVIFSADSEGCAAILTSFDLLPNGKFGMIQKHGGVHPGDVLFEINDINLSNMKYEEVVRLVKDRNMLKKVFKFMNSREYYRRKRGGSIRGGNPVDGKNNFLSTIKRTRISEERGRKHVEYEIACQFRLASTKVATEVVYQWSTWKRYSEFEALHSSLRSSLGWQMEGIELPSPYTFVFNKLTPEFIAQRRAELVEYWSKVIAIDKATDFQKHHCSQDLKSFLEVEMQTRKEVTASPDALIECPVDDINGESENNNTSKNNQYGGGAAAPATRRASATRANSRRLSAKSVSVGNNGGSFPEVSAPTPASTINVKAAAPSSSSTTVEIPQSSQPVLPAQAPLAAKPATPAAPPRPAAPPAPAASTAPASVTSEPPPLAGGNLPPKPTGARANLLGAIAARRID